MMKLSKSRIDAVQAERVMLMKLEGRIRLMENKWKMIIIEIGT